MKENGLIQVLWVEDDPTVTKTYPLKAEIFDLQLVPFPCWDDAKIALERDYDRWSAIILDAKCKQHRESADNPVRFLGEALKDIAAFAKEKRRVIPWYILTGGAEFEVSDSITDDRMKWDTDWTMNSNKNFYSKNVDNEELFKRIRDHANKSAKLQIQEMYPDVFRQLSQLNTEVCEDILSILEAMHFPDSQPTFNPRHFFNPLRKALEYVFRAANSVGIIHDDFFKGGQVNINQCFMFLIGCPAEKLKYRYGKDGDRITPRYIQDMMSLIINLGNLNSHSIEDSHTTELSEEEVLNYDNYLRNNGVDSRLLIFSLALQMCEIVRWMNQYIEDHPNKEDNLKKNIPLNNNKTIFEGYIEKHDGIFHIGEDYSVLLKREELLGKKVQILNCIPNTNPKTQKYKYFVREIDFKLIE